MKKNLALKILFLFIVKSGLSAECVSGNCSDGTGEFYYGDGSYYSGTWKSGKRNGSGIFYKGDGSVYEGEYLDDLPHNHGVYTFPDGKKKRIKSNHGKVIFSVHIKNKISENGFFYGEFSNRGKYTGWYSGNLKNGYTAQLRGKMQWEDGSEYSGEWKNGKISGRGSIKWKDGSFYTGEWLDGKRYGRGIYFWPDGKKYIGEWKDNSRHGQGICIYPDGREEAGLWLENRFSGK